MQFFDHIPQMLDALERTLRASALRDSLDAHLDEVEKAEDHGLQRWQQGYDEGEVMHEWILLNTCLCDEMQAYASAPGAPDGATLSTAWRLVAEFTIAGMSESVAQYNLLQRTEAAGRVQALDAALQRLNDLERQRADLWREATHDLRGNLGVVRNVATALQKRAPPAPDQANALRLLERGVASLHDLLDDLTVQARLDAGQEQREIAPFDVSAALSELCANGRLMVEESGLFLAVDGPPGLTVDGDEVKVRRIAQNLLQNALTYTREGGVRVSWSVLEEPPRRWVLCVQDTGPGLPARSDAPLATAIEAATRDTLSIVADKAVAAGKPDPAGLPAPTLASASATSGPRARHGEGVGLSIVKRLCELLDASLELQTAPGDGTTFRVTFPVRYPKG